MMEKSVSKRITLLILALMATGLLWVPSPAEDLAGLDEILIESDAWPKKKYEPTRLTHQKHATEYKIECEDCHHIYRDGQNLWEEGQRVQLCAECHTFVGTGKALRGASPEEKTRSLYKAFHKNCMGCHKEQQKGPVKCLECHPKREKK
jgi:hypothetical protein